MKGLLSYFRNTRIKYKQLAEEYASIDKKKSTSYDRKQLPIKIFINSMFGALSAPQVFHWGDMDKGEMITCTGRQYLRMMIHFFMDRGYTPLVMDTDGINFSVPEGVEERKYVGKGLNWKVKGGKEYVGEEADVMEFNDLAMRGEMALDTDGQWPACINLARKNYALITAKGKIKLTGNSIKSKKMPAYIEKFLDKGIKLLLDGKGQEFIEWYFEYVQKIYDKQIPLIDIANKSKVKQSIPDYVFRSNQLTKAGNLMSRQAHMELAIKEGLNVNLGDVIFYVNNGNKSSQGDVQKVNKPKKGWSQDHINSFGGPIPEDLESIIQLNCYRIDPLELESNPNMTGDYNVPRAITTFNKRVEPLLVVFSNEISQCELINNQPYNDQDQDKLEDVMEISNEEMDFWTRVNISPYHMYNDADEVMKKYVPSS
jgi:DNA polymerase elongation subunit (family B)